MQMFEYEIKFNVVISKNRKNLILFEDHYRLSFSFGE